MKWPGSGEAQDDGPEKHAVLQKHMFEEMERLRLDVPNYEKLRKQQLREWVESLPAMPPEELLT